MGGSSYPGKLPALVLIDVNFGGATDLAEAAREKIESVKIFFPLPAVGSQSKHNVLATQRASIAWENS